MQFIFTPSHRISLESPTGHIILFSLALVLNVQPELFTFVAILDNSQSGHLGHIFLPSFTLSFPFSVLCLMTRLTNVNYMCHRACRWRE
jgi:hypothetical protein